MSGPDRETVQPTPREQRLHALLFDAAQIIRASAIDQQEVSLYQETWDLLPAIYAELRIGDEPIEREMKC